MSIFLEDFADDDAAGGVVVNPTTYANGYSFRRTLRIGGSAIAGSATLLNLPLRVDETLPGLKTTANGGLVQSAAGWDIRFELPDGTQLDHELETYDGAAGRAACWVRLPSSTPGADRDIFLYYGNSGLPGPEANPAGVWIDCLGCWRAPDGRDMTGAGRNMTTSGVSSGTILGHPASVLGASSYLECLDVTFLDARSQLTPVLLFQAPSQPAANADFARVGGTAGGTGKLGLTYIAGTHNLRGYVRLGSNTSYLLGPGESLVAGHPTLLAMAALSGAWPEMLVDGADVTETRSGSFGPGTTSIASTDFLRVGASFGDNTTCVPGSYGRFWIFSYRLPTEFLAFLDLTIRAPRACYGIGDEDSPAATDRSPVMAPIVASVALSGTINIDTLSRAADPDGQGMLAGLGSPSPSLGSASVVANLVRYVGGSVAGLDRFGVTATAGTKVARTLCSTTVGVAGGGPTSISLPVAPQSAREANWEKAQTSGLGAVLTQGTTTVELKGAAPGTLGGQIGVVSLRQFTPPFTVSYGYQPLSLSEGTPPDSNGFYAQLHVYAANGADPNLATALGTVSGGVWTANYGPVDEYYAAIPSGSTVSRAHGIRFSIDTHSINGTGDNQIRGRAIQSDGTITTQLAYGTGGQKVFNMRTPGGRTQLDWSFPGDSTVTVTATFSNGATMTQVFDDPLITRWLGTEAHNIALMVNPGRDAQFDSVVVTQGSGNGGPGPVPPPDPGGGPIPVPRVVGSEGFAPDFPDPSGGSGYGLILNTDGGSLQADYNALTTAQINSGVMLLVNYGFGAAWPGGITLGKNGPAAKPIIIRVGGLTGGVFTEPNGSNVAPNGTGIFPTWNAPRATVSWAGGCVVTGSNNWVRGLRFQGGANISGSGCRFNRCLFDGPTSNCTDSGVGNIWDWCEWTLTTGICLNPAPRLGNRNLWVYRCWVHDYRGPTSATADNGVAICVGNGPHDQWANDGTPYDANPVIQDVMLEDWNGSGNSVEIKCSGAKVLRCSQRQGTGTSNQNFNQRHGDRGWWQACNVGDGSLMIRGIGCTVADCTSFAAGRRGPAGGNITATDWAAYIVAHNITKPVTTNYPTAEGCVFAGIDFNILLGAPNFGGTIPPTGTIVENDCTGGVNKNTTLVPLPTYTTRPRSVPPYREKVGGPIKKPRMWTGGSGASADVGPNGKYSSAQ